MKRFWAIRALIVGAVVFTGAVASCTHAGVSAPAAPDTSAAVKPETAEQTRIRALFNALDLDRPDLAPVKAYVSQRNFTAAGQALIAHYRASRNAMWVRSDFATHRPDDLREADHAVLAAEALTDTFTFQGVKGEAPRTREGGLDWSHRGPRNDLEWALFFNRHFLFVPLVEQYQRTKDPALARYADRTMRDWIMSRPPEYTETERQMSAAWRPMSTASRLLQAWPHVFFGFLDSPDFSDETRLLMLASIPEQSAHLQRYHRKRHNHTIKEMAGLAHAAAVWPEFSDASAWRSYAITTLKGELDRQFYPDGVHQELSAHYHRSALEYFLWVRDFEGQAGRSLPADFSAGLERAGDYLAASLSPQGVAPLNNNGDLDDNRALLLDLAARFGREDWRYVASQGRSGAAPRWTSRSFPWAGHAFFRNGFGADAHFSMFDFGPWGAAHQHDDKLNLTISAYGRALLTDGGRYRYTPDDPVVAYLRGSAGHNVVLVDGKGQNPDATLTETPDVGAVFAHPTLDFAIASFDAGFRDTPGVARHQRAVLYLRDRYWLVVDRFQSDRLRGLTALWRFAHDATVGRDGVDAVSTDAGAGNLRITPLSAAPMALELIRGREAPNVMGWYSPGYNDRRAATVAQFSFPAETGATYAAWIMTPARDTPPRLVGRIVSKTDAGIQMRVDGARIAINFAAADQIKAGEATRQPILSFQTGRAAPVQYPN